MILLILIQSISSRSRPSSRFRGSFIDYFPSETHVKSMSNLDTRPNIDSGCHFIHNCMFKKIQYHENGGVISIISDNQCYMLVESSTFQEVVVNGDYQGGAIYFLCSQKGSSVLSKVCAANCSTNIDQYHQFALIGTSFSQLNSAHYLSIVACNPISGSAHSAMKFLFGNQTVSGINSTKHSLSTFSGAYFRSSKQCVVQFSTFADTKVQYRVCIMFHQGDNDLFRFSNFVNNSESQTNSNQPGLITSYESSTAIEECVFSDNSPTLFHVEKGSLDIFRSWIPPNVNTIGIYICKNKGITQTHKLRHFKSLFCDADTWIE